RSARRLRRRWVTHRHYAARKACQEAGSEALIFALPGSLGAPPCSLMNFSVSSRACESGTWTGGDFIRYELGASSGPPTPWFNASLQQRTASVTMPAEFGESQTSSLISTL